MKQTLLNTGIFIDNKYLDSYVKLISKQHKIKGYAEWHHIIPVSYYAKLHNLQLGKNGRHKAEVIADADINNKKVLLSYADHCKAHWLLSKCLVAEYAKSSASAFLKMLNVVWQRWFEKKQNWKEERLQIGRFEKYLKSLKNFLIGSHLLMVQEPKWQVEIWR